MCIIFGLTLYTCFTGYAGNAFFDASQYAFFGQENMEEVELGGLEDEEDDTPVVGYGDDEYHLFDKEEVGFVYCLNVLQSNTKLCFS